MEPFDFHLRAAEIKKISDVLNLANPLSPVGNDDGADLLFSYQRWRLTHGPADNSQFICELFGEWELPKDWGEPEIVASAKVSENDADDDYIQRTGDRALVAFAFAQLIIDGNIEEDCRNRALLAVDRQLVQSRAYAQKFGVSPERLRMITDSFTRQAELLRSI